jgi:diguanylate cyclase (GGDEF)-like protein
LKRWQLLILISLIAGLLVEALFIFRPLVRKVHGSMDVLTQLACHDGLTQLANQRHFMEIAARELLLSHRSRQPIALLMIDIDHFKPINDTHGHAAGDAAIVLTAGIIKQAVRQTDIVGRIGGDEFAVLLSAADPQRVQIIAEKIRNAIAAARLRNCEMGWTVSIGATCWKYQDAEIEMLMKRADRALYLAKKSGRNCIIDDNACESGHPLDRDASV